jgi:membrane-associated protease RseP (regulator of RpoE activity)
MLVFVAIAVLGLLVVVHELGHFLAARLQGIAVTRFSIGFGPVLWRFQGPQTEYALRAIPLGGYVAFPDDELDETFNPDDPSLLKNRPILDRAIVMVAGVLANLVFAYLLLMFQLGTAGLPSFTPQPGVQIPQVFSQTNSAAYQAGLQPGDVVLKVNQTVLESGSAGISTLKNAIDNSQGNPLSFSIQRGETPLEIQVTPILTEDGMPKIGVQLSPNGVLNRRRAKNPIDLVWGAAEEFQRIVKLTVLGFGQLFLHFQDAVGQVSGPVAIVAMGADIAKSDIANLLQFAALISVNLAIINILPLPALDGGHLAFLLFEGIRGKPIPMEYQQGIMQTGLMFIFGLGVLLIVRDTANLAWVQQLLQ